MTQLTEDKPACSYFSNVTDSFGKTVTQSAEPAATAARCDDFVVMNMLLCCSLNLPHALQLEISHISQNDSEHPPESGRDLTTFSSGFGRDV